MAYEVLHHKQYYEQCITSQRKDHWWSYNWHQTILQNPKLQFTVCTLYKHAHKHIHSYTQSAQITTISNKFSNSEFKYRPIWNVPNFIKNSLEFLRYNYLKMQICCTNCYLQTSLEQIVVSLQNKQASSFFPFQWF